MNGRHRHAPQSGQPLSPLLPFPRECQSPRRIAEMAGFSVPEDTQALIGEVDTVGPGEPLSMETLSPILSFYVADGWEAGCERCIEILEFGGIGHTLALHASSDRVIEQFAVKKPSMRIVVNTVAALGSVGMTTSLFPAMTLGPGTIGGSITSDNITPLHLVNIKRVAFETAPLNSEAGDALASSASASSTRTSPPANSTGHSAPRDATWMDEIEERLLARAGNPVSERLVTPASAPRPQENDGGRPGASVLPLPDATISELVKTFRK